jgi:hypothetical protein
MDDLIHFRQVFVPIERLETRGATWRGSTVREPKAFMSYSTLGRGRSQDSAVGDEGGRSM